MSIADAEQAAGQSADVFGQFCAAGLWPGLGRALAAQLPGAEITGPEQVSAARLQKLDGVGPKRARRLAAAFEDALPSYDTAEVLVSCRVPARYAAAAVSSLGKSAAIRLREDPWLLLSLPQIEPGQADWFARQLLAGQAHPQDPRRGRALVGYLLTRAARDGHTAVPADVVLRSVARFGVDDPAAAVAAAVDEGSVLPFDGAEPEAPAGESAVLLALARYALAEEAIAEGLAWLSATAEPLAEANAGGPQAGAAKVMPNGTDGEAIELDEAQRGAVTAVARHGVSVLSGGPGTGKSRTVAAVVALAADQGMRVALAAPTGRAAKRLEELAGRARHHAAPAARRAGPRPGRRGRRPAGRGACLDLHPGRGLACRRRARGGGRVLDAGCGARRRPGRGLRGQHQAAAGGRSGPAALDRPWPGAGRHHRFRGRAGHRADHPVPTARRRGDRAPGHRGTGRRARAGGLRRGRARGGGGTGPRQSAGRVAGDAARHRLDPPRPRHPPGRNPGRHARAQGPGRHHRAEPGAQGDAQPGTGRARRVRPGRPGGGGRQPHRRGLRQRRGRHGQRARR